MKILPVATVSQNSFVEASCPTAGAKNVPALGGRFSEEVAKVTHALIGQS